MTKPQSPLSAIERPRCPRCQARMPLATTTPTKSGHQRTFRCAPCATVRTIEIAADPMKSGSVGWLTGELKPPT